MEGPHAEQGSRAVGVKFYLLQHDIKGTLDETQVLRSGEAFGVTPNDRGTLGQAHVDLVAISSADASTLALVDVAKLLDIVHYG